MTVDCADGDAVGFDIEERRPGVEIPAADIRARMANWKAQ
jgi:hypothetical protein